MLKCKIASAVQMGCDLISKGYSPSWERVSNRDFDKRNHRRAMEQPTLTNQTDTIANRRISTKYYLSAPRFRKMTKKECHDVRSVQGLSPSAHDL